MSLPTPVYWTTLAHNSWTFHLAATDNGLCCMTLPNETLATLQQWVTSHIPEAVLIQEKPGLRRPLKQITEYLDGQRRTFSIPLDLKGTPFQVQVWQTLLDIPFGETQSYSQISERINKPRAVRAVGAANGANPIPIVIPCHRVIGKNGTLTGYRGGIAMKAELLALEGH